MAAANNPKRASNTIFDRLTDPKTFTGAHKHRFGDDGKGLGKVGRTEDDKVTDLCQLTRANLHVAKTPNPKRTSGIDLSNIQKFGTQAEKAKAIEIYANGDVNAEPKKVTLSKAINNWEKFLVECTKQLKLSTGPCKKIYKVTQGTDGNTHKKVLKLEDIEDGAIYLGCGAEEIIKDKYPKKLEPTQ